MELTKTAAWSLLVVAGLFEVAWAITLKYTAGYTRLMPSLLTVAAMAISMGLLGIAARVLPIGTAYTVWTGIGSVGAVVVGIILLGDSANALRLVCLGLIVVGIIGLKLTGK